MKSLLKFSVSILLILVISLMSITGAFAAPEVDTEITDLCNAWMLVDATSGSVIIKSDNAGEKIAPASTTKLLTAIVALDKCKLSDEVVVNPIATMLGDGSSKCGLVAEETVTVEDLLYGLMLVSGNDAALALAYHISGSVDGFAELMNETAQEIGMKNSQFKNPHGLDNEEHYVTCEDMAKLALYAMQYDVLMEICATTEYRLPQTKDSVERLIHSTNKLIYTPESDSVSFKYEYATGMKTGSTYSGGGCIVASAEKEGQKLIALVFGDPTQGGVNRWKIASYLFDYGFDNYTTIDVTEQMKSMEIYADVKDASDPTLTTQVKLNVEFPDNMVVTLDNDNLGDSPEFTYRIAGDAVLKTPFNKGDTACKVEYLFGGNVVYETTGYYSQSIANLSEYLGKESIITEIDTQTTVKESAEKDYSKLWWWLVIPGAIIIFIVIRLIVTRSKRPRKFSAYKSPSRRGSYRHKRHRRRSSPARSSSATRRARGTNLRRTSSRRSHRR